MSRNLASLIAGFGTGYFAGEKQKRDEARQAKMDKIQEQQAEREQLRFETEQKDRENRALTEQKMREAAMPTNASKTNLDAAGLQQAMPQVFAEADPTNPSDTMTGEQKAQHFIENSTPEQRLNNASFYAQQGVTALGDKKIVQGDAGQIATIDPKQDVQKEDYQKLMDQGNVLINTGKAENIATGNQLLSLGVVKKTEAYNRKIMAAEQEAKATGKLDPLLNLMNNHDNKEVDITNAKVTKNADGKFVATWTIPSSGKERTEEFDPKNGTPEQQIALYLHTLNEPEKHVAYLMNQVTQDRENRKEEKSDKFTDLQLQKVQQDIDEGKIKIDNLPEETRLKLQALKANINQSNAATEASRTSTKKTKEEMKAGSGKLPASVQEAMWYKDASPELKSAFDKLNTKEKNDLKVTADQTGGGYIVTTNNKAYQVNKKGETKEFQIPGATTEKTGSPEYQEYLEVYTKLKGYPDKQKEATRRARESGIVE